MEEEEICEVRWGVRFAERGKAKICFTERNQVLHADAKGTILT